MADNQMQVSLTPEIQEAFKPEVLDVMKNTFAPNATDAEFVLFAHKAASYGLDPFKNEIFFIKYGNQARIQFAAEAYLAKAREQEGFTPPNTQMVHENDEFKVSQNKETGDLEVEQHEIGFPRGKIIGAYSVAHRDGYRPVTVIMDIDEISHMFTGQNKDNWNKWTSDMFGKHVQQRALKKQYGLEFDDVTINEQQGSDIPEYTPKERKDVTPNEQPERVIEDNPESPADKLKKQMVPLFKQLGMTTKKEQQEYIAKHAPDMSAPPTEQELIGLLNIMEMHLDMQEQEQASDDELPE